MYNVHALIYGDYSTEYVDGVAYAAISRWGKTQYTNIAISTGVAANAINTGLYSGLGAVIGTFAGIPMQAIQGLLNGVSWTKRGSKPGAAVAKLWDKNKNGWIGFYYQKGYDTAGRVVATRYSTLQIMKKIKKFVEHHPYWSVILFGLIASIFWIIIEYIDNKDFRWNGIYGLIFYYIIALSSVKYKLSKNKKDKVHIIV